MAEILVLAVTWLKSHIAMVVVGFLGACFGVLLSKEPWKDRLIGALAGFILCIVFAEHASQFLANGNYPEIFGFALGAMGKATAETLLSFARSKLLSTVTEKGDQHVDPK